MKFNFLSNKGLTRLKDYAHILGFALFVFIMIKAFRDILRWI